jgi:hypothetical protein
MTVAKENWVIAAYSEELYKGKDALGVYLENSRMNIEFINKFNFTIVYIAEERVAKQGNKTLVVKTDEYKIRKWHGKLAKGLALRHIIFFDEKEHRYGECIRITNPTQLPVDSDMIGFYTKNGLKTRIIPDSEDLQGDELLVLIEEIQSLREETPVQTT